MPSIHFICNSGCIAGELESEDIGLHLKLLSLLENPAVIVAAAAAGDVGTLRDFLSKHPHEVNTHTHTHTCLFMFTLHIVFVQCL